MYFAQPNNRETAISKRRLGPRGYMDLALWGTASLGSGCIHSNPKGLHFLATGTERNRRTNNAFGSEGARGVSDSGAHELQGWTTKSILSGAKVNRRQVWRGVASSRQNDARRNKPGRGHAKQGETKAGEARRSGVEVERGEALDSIQCWRMLQNSFRRRLQGISR